MTAQAPVVQGAVSEALSKQDIAFGANLWRRRSPSEAAIPLLDASTPDAFSSQVRLETHQRQRLPYLRNAAHLWPGSTKVNALFLLARAFGEGQ